MPAQKLVDRHNLRILNMDATVLPSNNSHQELVSSYDCDNGSSVKYGGDSPQSPDRAPRLRGRRGGLTCRNIITVSILCFVNLINYMDRFTLAGILSDIQKYYGINDALSGLLQTAFVISYMIFAPLFGYLGDRYSRKAIMAFGVFLWGLTTLVGSYMDKYGWFLLCRALVGVGEASYSTIAPTIISDLFVSNMRSKMLAVFYFAIPVGSGLGYIIGSQTALLMGSWQWGLRVTPVLGAVAVILIVFVLQDPPRGESEGGSHLKLTSWGEDIRDIVKNRSFMLSTLGFTCVAFVTGALAWWGPTFVLYGMQVQPGNEDVTIDSVSFKFGIITMISGLLGVPLGSFAAMKIRKHYAKADPTICAFSLIFCAPFLYTAAITARFNTPLTYALIFFGELLINLNWAIVADMLLYVVIPTRRSTAEAFQILFSHAFGDAGSPYLIGQVSEVLKTYFTPSEVTLGVTESSLAQVATTLNSTVSLLTTTAVSAIEGIPEKDEIQFRSLQYSLFMTGFVVLLGGIFFLFTSFYIVADKAKVEEAVNRGKLTEDEEFLQHLDADVPPTLVQHGSDILTDERNHIA